MDDANLPWFDGLRVFRFNHLPDHGEWLDRRLETWALNYAETGSLVWQPDDAAPMVLEGPVAFWSWPGPRWRYGGRDAHRWDHRFVSFTGERAREWQRRCLLPAVEPGRAWRPITDPAGFAAAFDSLLLLLARAAPDAPEVVHRLEGLLLRLHRQPPAAPPRGSRSHRVAELVAAVKADPSQDWDFAAHARRLDCTPVHFRRLWRERTATSPGQFLQKLRLDLAARLLRDDGLTLAEVAERVGIPETAYFNRLFSRAHGLPPGRYRKEFREG